MKKKKREHIMHVFQYFLLHSLLILTPSLTSRLVLPAFSASFSVLFGYDVTMYV